MTAAVGDHIEPSLMVEDVRGAIELRRAALHHLKVAIEGDELVFLDLHDDELCRYSLEHYQTHSALNLAISHAVDSVVKKFWKAK